MGEATDLPLLLGEKMRCGWHGVTRVWAAAVTDCCARWMRVAACHNLMRRKCVSVSRLLWGKTVC